MKISVFPGFERYHRLPFTPSETETCSWSFDETKTYKISFARRDGATLMQQTLPFSDESQIMLCFITAFRPTVNYVYILI